MNPFVGLPIVELLKLRERYLRVLGGDEFVQTGSSGLSSVRHRMSHDDAMKGLTNVTEALRALDPVTYGGPHVTRTVGDHRFATDR